MINKKHINEASAVILAGGKSTRMGRDKASMIAPLNTHNETMIEAVYERLEHSFEQIYISGKENKNYIEGSNFIEDLQELEGPMAGLLASLSEVESKWLFLTACDMPFIRSDLIEYMALKRKNYDIVVPYINGHLEPLCSFYSKKSFKKLLLYFARGGRSLYRFIKETKDLKVVYVTKKEIEKIDSGCTAFMDIDSMEDFERAEAMKFS